MVPIDPGLLGHAKEAAGKVIDAEKQLQIAKAEYHAEVRRLHLAGASLREIAAALGISHQRVQQIVDDAGGSWWTKLWKNRNQTALADIPCTFCGKPRAQVDKLISGPDLFICDACIGRAERVAKSGTPHPPFTLARPAERLRCSFCLAHQSTKEDRRMLVGGSRRVCTKCLALCRQILEEGA